MKKLLVLAVLLVSSTYCVQREAIRMEPDAVHVEPGAVAVQPGAVALQAGGDESGPRSVVGLGNRVNQNTSDAWVNRVMAVSLGGSLLALLGGYPIMRMLRKRLWPDPTFVEVPVEKRGVPTGGFAAIVHGQPHEEE